MTTKIQKQQKVQTIKHEDTKIYIEETGYTVKAQTKTQRKTWLYTEAAAFCQGKQDRQCLPCGLWCARQAASEVQFELFCYF